MQKILTVVVPVYNMEMHLKRCLDSLIVSDSLIHKLEVIVINDGSKDNSINIMREYEKAYPLMFKVIDKENRGHGSCWNIGLREANGLYISFLDSDDWYDNNSLEYVLPKLELINVDAFMLKVMIRHNIHIDKDHVFNRNYYSDLVDNSLYDTEVFDYKERIHIFYFQNLIYKTSILRDANCRFLEKTSYDDTILDVVGMLTIKNFIFVDRILYNYFHERQGQSIYEPISRKKVGQLYNVIFDCFYYYEEYSKYNTIDSNTKAIVNSFALYKLNFLLQDNICALPYSMSKEFLSKYKKDFKNNLLYLEIEKQMDSVFSQTNPIIWLKYGLKYAYYRKLSLLLGTPLGKLLKRLKDFCWTQCV